MTLKETQALFYALATRALPADSKNVEGAFVGTDELPATDRVAIYRDMYLARLIDALGETFPNLARYLGEERFAELGEDYVALNPSEHHDVTNIGRNLPEFLREHPHPERPDLADLALLEWTRNEVFFAPDTSQAGPDDLALVAPEEVARVSLRMAASLRLIEISSGAASLWERMTAEQPADPFAPNRVALVVWRQGFEVLHCTVAKTEARALRAALNGQELSAICTAFEDGPDPAADAHAALASWFREGWIADVSVAAERSFQDS